MKDEIVQDFFTSDAFDTMLLKVGLDDVQSFKNNNEWLRHHPKEALIFKSPEDTWNQLKDTYKGNFKGLVYGELPDEEGVLATILKIKQRLTDIIWRITL